MPRPRARPSWMPSRAPPFASCAVSSRRAPTRPRHSSGPSARRSSSPCGRPWSCGCTGHCGACARPSWTPWPPRPPPPRTARPRGRWERACVARARSPRPTTPRSSPCSASGPWPGCPTARHTRASSGSAPPYPTAPWARRSQSSLGARGRQACTRRGLWSLTRTAGGPSPRPWSPAAGSDLTSLPRGPSRPCRGKPTRCVRHSRAHRRRLGRRPLRLCPRRVRRPGMTPRPEAGMAWAEASPGRRARCPS
mmetsp:Transcript_4271/g.14285  ORF Transcript_4271/g.14285 Transcript_4271/m.14285 type:complete len:251 (+) Transcript_4271:112-864(+)